MIHLCVFRVFEKGRRFILVRKSSLREFLPKRRHKRFKHLWVLFLCGARRAPCFRKIAPIFPTPESIHRAFRQGQEVLEISRTPDSTWKQIEEIYSPFSQFYQRREINFKTLGVNERQTESAI